MSAHSSQVSVQGSYANVLRSCSSCVSPAHTTIVSLILVHEWP